MWYGLETVFETIVFLGSSVAVARYLGTTKLGYFMYINFFVSTITRTGGSGLASATRRYMAEFLAQDKPGSARAVYRFTYRYQLMGSLAIVSVCLACVALFGEPQFRLMSSILILSLIPGVMSWIPAQANLAYEDVSNNTLSAFVYMIVYAIVIALTIHFHWDLVGVASASAAGRTLEVFLRTIPLHARLRRIPLEPLPDELIRRIRRFCLQAFGLQLLATIVWDRSEMLFLRTYSSLEQIAFYSVSFSLSANLLLVPKTFGGATGISLMVEALRDPKRVDSIVRNTARFLLLVVLPVHLGAIAITTRAIGVVYGTKYLGAISILMVAALLSIPRGFSDIGDTLLRAADRQNDLLRWTIITGVLNLGLDWALIPHFAAVGAAWANGIAQTFGIVAIWRQASRAYVFHFPVASAIRLFLAASMMALIARGMVMAISGAIGLTAAILAAIPAYILGVRWFRGLEVEDATRLAAIAPRLPNAFRPAYVALVNYAAHA
jgi:O-antigen/teichoic acid export membrane protein